MKRRGFIGRIGALTGAGLGGAALLSLGACGFSLQRPLNLPFRSLALQGFVPGSALATALRQALERSAVVVVAAPTPAQVLLKALAEETTRSVVASTAAGQVREIQLRLRLFFEARDAQGRSLIAPTELMLARELSFTEAQALGKSAEEAALNAEMRDDVVQQLMRRLAALAL